MAEWLARYSPRERLIIYAAAAVLFVLLVHALVLEPYQTRKQALQDELEQQRSDLEWMRSAVARLPAGGLTPANNAQINGTLANFVDQAVRQQGLSAQLASMSPVGNDIIRMRLSAVDFNRLVGFIARIYSSGLQVQDIRITSTGTPGLVDSNIVLLRS